MDHELTDAERHPTLTQHGRRMLERLYQHPHAPVFRNRAGSRLTYDDVLRVRAFAHEVSAEALYWRQDEKPGWLRGFVEQTWREVPAYRMRGALPALLENMPTTSRADLAHDITHYVPDGVALQRLINFRTSGTSGHPLVIPSLPAVAASYLPLHQHALRRFGIELQAGQGDVGVVLLGHQRQCFTYASVAPLLNEAGYIKLNLHPADWRDPADRARYLDDLKPEIFSGDPLSFTALLELPLTHQPRALVSTAMTLTPALRGQLEARFACPVLDVYSLTEAGPIAVYDARHDGHVLLQPRLYVEILDGRQRPCAPGEIGEITLTGGFNDCLPLLRYRTGDHAALACVDGEWVLHGLQGRAPVRFRAGDGTWVNSIDVSHALQRVPLSQYRLHQRADGSLLFRYAAGDTLEQAVAPALQCLLGTDISIVRTAFDGGKVVQYSSELAGAV
jgi:phenylacetate-CoA ligase